MFREPEWGNFNLFREDGIENSKRTVTPGAGASQGQVNTVTKEVARPGTEGKVVGLVTFAWAVRRLPSPSLMRTRALVRLTSTRLFYIWVFF